MSTPQSIIVDTPSALAICLKALRMSTLIAVDLEGIDLCREGRVCLMQIYATGSDTVWIVDVTVLGAAAFGSVGAGGESLKRILEDTGVKKLFYDCRNDADALIAHYSITPAGVYDVQLAELLHRRQNRQNTRFVHGLSKSITTYLGTRSYEFERNKRVGLSLFAPERGGSYEVFEQRPLKQALVDYSAQDVILLEKLDDVFSVGQQGKVKVMKESEKRVRGSAAAGYVPKGRHKALAPAGF